MRLTDSRQRLAWTICIACLATACSREPAVSDDHSPVADFGQFYVGGTVATAVDARGRELAEIQGQSLVTYAIPKELRHPDPIVLVPGLGLTSFMFTGTPDGRMGWMEALVREGHAVYVFDPVDYGTSPQPAIPFQLARAAVDAGEAFPGVPSIAKWNHAQIWERWGIGPEENVFYPDSRFPRDAVTAHYGSWAARWTMPAPEGSGGMGGGGGMGMGDAPANPNLVELVERIGPAIIAGHSAGFGMVDTFAARRPDLTRAVVSLESVGCGPSWDDFGATPFLAIFADYAYIGRADGRLARCANTAKASRDGGGIGDLLLLPEIPQPAETNNLTEEQVATLTEVATPFGVTGNDHLFTQDNNNAQTARALSIWIKSRVGNASPPADEKLWAEVGAALAGPNAGRGTFGSFFVGGEFVAVGEHRDVENQALVTHVNTDAERPATPVVMLPDIGLNTFVYTRTPDDRDGWLETFAGLGRDAYAYDWINTGNSPQDSIPFALLGDGELCYPNGGCDDPDSSDPRLQAIDKLQLAEVRETFRLGPGSNYPAGDIVQLQRSFPAYARRVNGGDDAINAANVVELLERSGPAVLLAHGRALSTAVDVAQRRPDLVAGIVSVSPGECLSTTLELPYASVVRADAADRCSTLSTVIPIPDNASHLVMQDSNNRAVAVAIDEWLRGIENR